MKKRIAFFGNGWSEEYIRQVLEGIRKCAHENNVDVFAFIGYAVGGPSEDNRGEGNILHLPNLADFDGMMLLTNSFNMPETSVYLKEEAERLNIPALSLNCEAGDMDFMGTDNYSGMHELAVHMIEVHGAKEILFVAGTQGNIESKIRCQAVQDAMSEHGLTLTEENMVCGEFSDYVAEVVMREWLEKHKKLPDAVLCANDLMALGVCRCFEKLGYKVPGDVAVTGYDGIDLARFYMPSISTVVKEGVELGYKGLQHLLDRIAGKTVAKSTSTPSHFVAAESCGCSAKDYAPSATAIFRSVYHFISESMDFDSHNRSMYMWIRSANTEEGVCRAMEAHLRNSHVFEGNNFAICLVQDFFPSIQKEERLQTEGYSEKMQTLCYIRDNQMAPRTCFDTRELVPDYDGDTPEEHIFMFVPLHNREICMGYAVFRDKEDLLDHFMLYLWARHIVQGLEFIRQNIYLELLNRKLLETSVRDGLTGVYNRMGYERYAIPYLKECRREGRYGVMLFADINRMKIINDRYGHLQGDIAICALASALQKALPIGAIVVRYGGDEFLAVGSCETQEQILELEEKINEALQREIESRKIEFDLSVSIGVVPVEDGTSLNIEECFKQADASMYQMKKEQHEKRKLV